MIVGTIPDLVMVAVLVGGFLASLYMCWRGHSLMIVPASMALLEMATSYWMYYLGWLTMEQLESLLRGGIFVLAAAIVVGAIYYTILYQRGQA